MVAAFGDVVTRKQCRTGDSLWKRQWHHCADNNNYDLVQISGKKVVRGLRGTRSNRRLVRWRLLSLEAKMEPWQLREQ